MVHPQDERALLLLGLLSSHPQHGYQINEFIEQNLGRVSQMKKATAYAMLARLESAGLVAAEEDREGNRPTRRVYSITEPGLQELASLLERILAQPEYEPPAGDIAVMLIDTLDNDIAIDLLQRRLSAIDTELVAMESAPPHEGHQQSIDLALSRRIALLRADRFWFADVLERLQNGTLVTNATHYQHAEYHHD